MFIVVNVTDILVNSREIVIDQCTDLVISYQYIPDDSLSHAT